MNLTPKQIEVLDGLKGSARHILLAGGSRSGKTYLVLSILVVRALRYARTRHLAARLFFNHAKVSLWMDTMPKVLAAHGLRQGIDYALDGSNYMVKFCNGSEIWVDGLDTEARVEKILGREYMTIFLNEVSQIGYESVLIVRTRLAQIGIDKHGTPGRTFGFYDCNPPTVRHWTYLIFKQGLDPKTREPMPSAGDYALYMMNPEDNRENLPQGYIENELDTLPSSKKKRFRYGEWENEIEGLVYGNWDIVEKVGQGAKFKGYGLDFGYSVDPSALIAYWEAGEDVYAQEILYETGLTNSDIAARMKELKISRYDEIRADSAEPKSIEELHRMGWNVKPSVKGPDSVRAGIDYLQAKRIHVLKGSYNVVNEFESYAWAKDKNDRQLPKPVDVDNHGLDALRYIASVKRARVASAGGAAALGL